MSAPFSVSGIQSVTLAWDPVTSSDVAGYNVYYGAASGNYTNVTSVGNVTNTTISGLIAGATYYFATTTFSTSGLESGFSSEVSYTVPNGVPGIQVTPGTISYGPVLVGTSATNQFVVQNVGTGTLSGSASVNAPFSVVSGGSYSLATGQTQVVVVVFSPMLASNYTQSVSFGGGTGTNVTVSGTATNNSSGTVTSLPPSVITETITAGITNPITLQFCTNLASPTWKTLGTIAGSTNLSFTNLPAVFIRGICSNLTGSVHLAWPASTSPYTVGYKIYYGTVSGIYPNVLDVGNTTTATISGLVGGKVYYFIIYTYGVLGKLSLYSNEISASAQTTGFSLTFTGH